MKNRTIMSLGIVLMLGSLLLGINYLQQLDSLLDHAHLSSIFYEYLALLCAVFIKFTLGFIAYYFPAYFKAQPLTNLEKKVKKLRLENIDTVMDLSVHLSRL